MTQLVPPAPAPGRAAPTGGRPRRRSALANRDNRAGLTMVLPTTLIILAIVIVPVIWNLVLAFQETDFSTIAENGLFNPLTLENFAAVFADPGFWSSLWTTIVYSVLSTAGSIAVGLIAALAFRSPFRGRGLARSLMLLLLPYVAPVVAVTFVWQIMLNAQFGIVNTIGKAWFGWEHPIDFLGKAPYALITVVVFEIWRYFPFAFLFITARMVALPGDVEEAALVDGVTPWQNFRHIVLPQLLPVISLLSVLRLIMTFNKFDDVYLLTGGGAGTEVSAVRVYDQLVGSFDIGGAAANAFVLSAILGVFLFVYVKFFAGKGDDE
ncbi:ABC transporter permease [Leifsonia xyli subsp. cynodontis DSM 46306]|uniref:ABC transmembrane type-1 domain-containing protein n=1 Tax=Leifsonia xyli subsp. cynodontis DSM 46306 TaxID=1389489 RepID=U3P8A0_LEIXC|nr:sugar ABC transporter permease [Leifsonia xyli]AGW42036.1 ABC transporter permease [Leifsonia xyli subsp. cynodontis DSM 46306]